MNHQVFLLSPARCSGKRADLLFNERAEFALARKLRTPQGAELGHVFRFLSGLYFRGKLAYALKFGRAPRGTASAQVITPDRGLRSVRTRVTLDDLRRFREVPIDADEPRYLRPLVRDAEKLAARLKLPGRIILLGSIATTKYSEPLRQACGEQVQFPGAFVGRGDMSRGGLLLRAADAGEELDHEPLLGTQRRGVRPQRLEPRTRKPTTS